MSSSQRSFAAALTGVLLSIPLFAHAEPQLFSIRARYGKAGLSKLSKHEATATINVRGTMRETLDLLARTGAKVKSRTSRSFLWENTSVLRVKGASAEVEKVVKEAQRLPPDEDLSDGPSERITDNR